MSSHPPSSPPLLPGSMAYMMITTGNGVAGFTLDPTLGAPGWATCSSD